MKLLYNVTRLTENYDIRKKYIILHRLISSIVRQIIKAYTDESKIRRLSKIGATGLPGQI